MRVRHLFYVFFIFVFYGKVEGQPCDPSVPSFTVDLSGTPDSLWFSEDTIRVGKCCTAGGSDKCIRFVLTLDTSAVGIIFNVASGAIPPGALYYQINCGPPVKVGEILCLSGPGPHEITFCKPGNNTNVYTIQSVTSPRGPDSKTVRNGCMDTLVALGFNETTILWNSIAPGAPGVYNSYLSCTSACDTTYVTPSGSFPPYVDYEVQGYPPSPCDTATLFKDTVRVYFVTDLTVDIMPKNAVICYGSVDTLLTTSASGGKPPYTYRWSTGSTASSVTVGPGTYWVELSDDTDCPPVYDTVTVGSFSLAISADAGNDTTICLDSSDIPLNGSIVSAGGGVWSGGGGVFAPSDTSLSASYTPTSAELGSGSTTIILTTTNNYGCPPGADTITILFDQPSLVSVGSDQVLCENVNMVQLNASISGGSNTGIWNTNGLGSFSPSDTILNAQYMPDIADLTGGVQLIFTSTNNGVCPPDSDSLDVTFIALPNVMAGLDQTLCSTAGQAVLSGTVTGGTSTGKWSSSTSGSFSPHDSTLNASYSFSSQDTAAGMVTLVLSSTNNAPCPVVTDSIEVQIKKPPSVYAGLNQSVCANNPIVVLTGVVSGISTTGLWSTSGDGTFSSDTSLNTTYALGSSDITSGTCDLILTSTGSLPCDSVRDTLAVFVTPAPVVNGGADQLICNTDTASLAGTVSGGSSTGTWTSLGSGAFSPSSDSLQTSYIPSSADTSAGQVTLILTSTSNGNCLPISDTVLINFFDLAIANAGADQLVCSTVGQVQLSGVVSGGTSTGIWSSNGTGAFSPGSTSLSPDYGITSGDIAGDSVQFILTSTDNGPCPAVSDTMMLLIREQPTVSISDTFACVNEFNSVQLSGVINGDTGSVFWLSSGNGTFSPSNNSNPTTYVPDPNDIVSGTTNIYFISNGNSPCADDTAKMVLTLLPKPVAAFTPSKFVAFIPNDPIRFSNNSVNGNFYTWDFGDGDSSTFVNPTHNYSQIGTYVIILIVENEYGCLDTAEVEVTVSGDIIFPTAFTPDGPGGLYNRNDLSNNIFFPYQEGVVEFHMMIFNRWGELIFETFDINVGWDGYYKNELCQQDSYVWKANGTFNDGRTFTRLGTVTLLR